MASLAVELTCSVCLELFHDLFPLSCGHSFCRSCLEESWRERGEEEHRCPLCRRRSSREHPSPNGTLRDISESFWRDCLLIDEITVPLLKRQANAYSVPLFPADLRMVLVGKTGSGKSAAGNTILGRKGRGGFESRPSPESVTKKCQVDEVMFGKKNISVTDTPGVYDTEFTNEALRREEEEEKEIVQWICDNFGEEALQYAIILFTHTDELKGMTLEQYVNKSSELKKLTSDCGGRFHGFNNNYRNSNQVSELLQKIERMVESNSGREHYTNDMYKRAKKQIEGASRCAML